VADDARLALTTMGFKRAEAVRAVDAAMAHVGHEVTLEALLRAALRACPRPRA
jgi:Holliday junction resolvasome RuvABC DNA-binding subunit